MKYFFVIFLFLHGAIHLMGFVKAFGLAQVEQLNAGISKAAGVFWLLAFIFFVIAAIMFAFKNSHWWAFGFIALVTSQVLIIFSWHDAKFGTIANVIVLVIAIIGYETSSYYSKYQNDVKTGLQQSAHFQNSELTESDIQQLPEPVKKYLRFTGAIGKPKVNNFKIEFTGKIRKNEQSEWMPFTSEQYNFMETEDRYSADSGTQLPWATPLKDYRKINGYKLAGNAEVIYSYPDRDLCYGTFKLIRIKYNCIDID